MPDYKAMYYHLAGRMAVAVDTMEVTVDALAATSASLAELVDKLKKAQQTTEEMFISAEDDDEEDTDG